LVASTSSQQLLLGDTLQWQREKFHRRNGIAYRVLEYLLNKIEFLRDNIALGNKGERRLYFLIEHIDSKKQ